MGVDRWARKKPTRRPKKNNSEKLRRQKTQRARLVKLGVEESKVKAMNPKKVRTLLKRPLRAKKAAAG